MRVLRGIAIFIVASVGVFALFDALGGAGWLELCMALIISTLAAVKLSRRMPRATLQ